MSRKLQPILIPDIMMGKVKSKMAGSDEISKIANMLAPYASRVDSGQMKIEIDRKAYNSNPDQYRAAIEICTRDPATSILVDVYKNYLANPRNYIITKGLTDALRRTSMDVKTSIIPPSFCGYLEIPNLVDRDGDKITGCYIVSKNNSVYCLCFSDRMRAMPHFHFNLNEAETLNELNKMYKYTNMLANGKMVKEDVGVLDYQAIILNCIIYITSNDADLVDRVNNFSLKKSKNETQRKIFSPSNFTVVGGNTNYEIIRKGLPNNIEVSSHFRWQRIGPKLQQHKLVFIKNYIKNKKE